MFILETIATTNILACFLTAKMQWAFCLCLIIVVHLIYFAGQPKESQYGVEVFRMLDFRNLGSNLL